MQDHIYRITEIVGTSHLGTDEAIKAALTRAAETIHNIRWFEVMATRGFVEADGKLQFQVTMKVGFTLDE